jgi:thiamine transport system permease protein
VLRRVELPLLLPALVAAASFAFAVSMGEFGASLVLSRQEFATIPVAIFDRLGQPGAVNYGAALALSSLLMGITAVAFLLLERSGAGEL